MTAGSAFGAGREKRPDVEDLTARKTLGPSGVAGLSALDPDAAVVARPSGVGDEESGLGGVGGVGGSGPGQPGHDIRPQKSAPPPRRIVAPRPR